MSISAIAPPVLALATLKLDFQLILPGAVVEQTGQAVGSAQASNSLFCRPRVWAWRKQSQPSASG
jgi:hypothetical protein